MATCANGMGSIDGEGVLRPGWEATSVVSPGSPVAFPSFGYSGQDCVWEPVRSRVEAANKRRTVDTETIGYRGVWTIQYGVMTTADRFSLLNIIAQGTIRLYPHYDNTDISYIVSVRSHSSLSQELAGKPIGYEGVSITFETVNTFDSIPATRDHTHYASVATSYVPTDQVYHYASVSTTYLSTDLVGHYEETD
ncbi:MAG: hypothetical protein GY832_30970 [Chloroflexi bacterium]|nr:hypothetical protein [Chloroflexota bacterium]